MGEGMGWREGYWVIIGDCDGSDGGRVGGNDHMSFRFVGIPFFFRDD